MRCPECQGTTLEAHELEAADGRCRTGVLACASCSAWYPIEDFILELLPERVQEPGRREAFFGRHAKALEPLGVRPPAGASQPDGDTLALPQSIQREHFDELARRKDEFSYQEALGRTPFWQAVRERTFGDWRSSVRPGSIVLDVGSADGLSTFPLAEAGAEILAFDISRESIALATAEAAERDLQNVTFFVADADQFPLRDETIDDVTCFGSLHHVPDPARTLGEIARVLKPGGVYLGSENNKTPLRPVFDLLMRLRPLWKEEAGAEALIGSADLERWTAGTALELETRPSVFLPPHLFNWLGLSAARRLLRWTDAVLGRIPLVRRWGGLIGIRGRKAASAPAAGDVLRAQRQPSEPTLQPLD